MDSSSEPSLAMLPLEVLMNINSYLDLQEYVNLQASSMRLRVSLKADDVCRDYAKHCMKFAFETDLARGGLIDYNTAIQRAYLTRMRFGLAKPYSVIVLGHSDGWFYREGILSYPLGDVIRILDVYNAAVTEDVIDVRSLISEEARCWPQHTQDIQELLVKKHHILILDYRKGILLFNLVDVHGSGYLVAIGLRKEVPVQRRLLMICTSSSHCEVQTDGRYIIVLEDPTDNVNLKLYDLEDERQDIQERHLPEFMMAEDADHQIYDGWFYLVSNRSLYREDGTYAGTDDYNYCYRFPLNESRPVSSYHAAGAEHLPEQHQFVRVRRQRPRYCPNSVCSRHRDWSSLKLWRDDYSGQLVIVEGWHHDSEEDDGENAQYTFQPFQFPEPGSAVDTAISEDELTYFGKAIQILDPADLPRGKDFKCPRDPGNRLRGRFYIPRVSTFLDIYPGSDETPDPRKGFEFHLAVASYSRGSLSEAVSDQSGKISSRKTDGLSPDANDKRKFVGVRRFPPNGAPEALYDLLWSTGKMNTNMFNCDDPRSILYSTKRLDRKWNETAQKVVLVNFDPYIRFPGLKSMVLRPLSTQLTPKEYEDELVRAKREQVWLSGEEFEEKRAKRQAKREILREMHKDDEVEEARKPKSPWFQTEQAMYLSIGQGFQFS